MPDDRVGRAWLGRRTPTTKLTNCDNNLLHVPPTTQPTPLHELFLTAKFDRNEFPHVWGVNWFSELVHFVPPSSLFSSAILQLWAECKHQFDIYSDGDASRRPPGSVVTLSVPLRSHSKSRPQLVSRVLWVLFHMPPVSPWNQTPLISSNSEILQFWYKGTVRAFIRELLPPTLTKILAHRTDSEKRAAVMCPTSAGARPCWTGKQRHSKPEHAPPLEKGGGARSGAAASLYISSATRREKKRGGVYVALAASSPSTRPWPDSCTAQAARAAAPQAASILLRAQHTRKRERHAQQGAQQHAQLPAHRASSDEDARNSRMRTAPRPIGVIDHRSRLFTVVASFGPSNASLDQTAITLHDSAALV
ncbi:hypothetical protein C8J57DRAFT_1227061 [Mycena rebaudengoi]|nr:hypothetical protein C8J57DRAFT_1227061 [Mycena rebaudengoi]